MSQQLDICENCGQTIGKLEISHLHHDRVVCAECARRLSSALTPPPLAPEAPTPRRRGTILWNPEYEHVAGTLVTCPACNRAASKEADRCPHCGHPIKRGFLGRAGTERFVNLGCLFIIMSIVALVLIRGCL